MSRRVTVDPRPLFIRDHFHLAHARRIRLLGSAVQGAHERVVRHFVAARGKRLLAESHQCVAQVVGV